jgi:hypothetical protein
LRRVLTIAVLAGGLATLGIGSAAQASFQRSSAPEVQETNQRSQPNHDSTRIIYRNNQYGFTLSLPATWKDFDIIVDTWRADANEASGPELLVRHPDWDEQYPRQDIPIMIFTRQQWKLVNADKLVVSAAPFGPGELGHNRKYVFAIPPRYNYAFLEGYEEVEEILGGHNFRAF